MTRAMTAPLLGLLTILAASCTPQPSADDRYDVVVEAGRVMDPESGLDATRNVGIRDGKIEAISESVLVGDRTIDAAGFVVAPGFIDLHVHQSTIAQSEETLSMRALDGVTCAFELEVGAGDVAAWYRAREGGQVINYGASVGHIPARMAVMDDSGTFLPAARAAVSRRPLKRSPRWHV